jgi:3-hydroxyacyl-[acyl-carrier-protein] dehydratase
MVSPLLARPRVVGPLEADPGGGDSRGSCTVAISAQEPVFDGHYPNFPILPGVCVVHCVHESASMLPPIGAATLELTGVISTRFVGAVYPGDDLTVDLAWKRTGTSWTCTATARTWRGDAANVRLRYRERGSE